MNAERVYRLLLRAYPSGFRAEFEREMVLVFHDLRRHERAGGARFWMALFVDVARSAPGQRLAALRALCGRDLRPGEWLMKALGILTVVIGLLEAAGAVAEGWAGGSAGDRVSIANGVVGAVAGVLLMAIGVSLIRRETIASGGRAGAAACLVAFLLLALVGGRMGIAATVLGVGISLALLIASYASRIRGSSAIARLVLLLAAVLALPSGLSAQTAGKDTTAAAKTADVPLTAAERQAIVGTYSVTLPQGDQTTLTITDVNGALMARPGNQDETRRLIYRGNNAFTVEGAPDFRMVFTVENGRATRFALVKGDGMGEGVRAP